jgi:peptidyl-dipeptidase Dcp
MRGPTTLLLIGVLIMSCDVEKQNPFYGEYNTPFATPPFAEISTADYLPAFTRGMQEQLDNIDIISRDTAVATFANTIAPLISSGELLSKVSSVFFNLNSAETNEELQAIAREVQPLLSQHRDKIMLNQNLFKRIRYIYNNERESLAPDQRRLVEDYYRDFVRGGAELEGADKERFTSINTELSQLTLVFGEHILAEDNRFALWITDEADLAGLPAAVMSAAGKAAEAQGRPEAWLFTLHKPSLIPFLQYAENRDLRRQLLTAYSQRGNNNDDLDNKGTLFRIAELRLERAKLLGYESHAAYVLAENMARTPADVYGLLDRLWQPALQRAKEEARELRQLMRKDGIDDDLKPWDWWYYAEKLKAKRYNLDDRQLRPYFQLENVRDGAFATATKLWGLTFQQRNDIPVYHPEVTAWEVKDRDGSHLAVLYLDYHPRPGKRGGAWMNNYREQYRQNGRDVRPIICNVCNFTRPTDEQPALLSLEEVETLFHEFGHALHGILSDVRYERLSGTNVARDFVELPSQIMENWAIHPEVIRSYARHYQTGETIPDALIERIAEAGHFNQGFATTEYLAAAYLDMAWHTLREMPSTDAMGFEKATLAKIGLIPEIIVRYRSPYFRHIFSGGYSAGYYSYVWAEVLDADAFSLFRERGIYDSKTAQSFRRYILSQGNSDDPMVLYERFRRRQPEITPLLEKRGLK